MLITLLHVIIHIQLLSIKLFQFHSHLPFDSHAALSHSRIHHRQRPMKVTFKKRKTKHFRFKNNEKNFCDEKYEIECDFETHFSAYLSV
jgi:hypothetical protein